MFTNRRKLASEILSKKYRRFELTFILLTNLYAKEANNTNDSKYKTRTTTKETCTK